MVARKVYDRVSVIISLIALLMLWSVTVKEEKVCSDENDWQNAADI